MLPEIKVLTQEMVERIMGESFELLLNPGIKVQSPVGRELLLEAGGLTGLHDDVIRIPESVVQTALETTPSQFVLYDQAGKPAVKYGGNSVHFDPGSSGVHMLDFDTLEHRPAVTEDLVSLVKVVEGLPEYAAQSTAVVCHDVPKEISDLYRLYLVLLFSEKPIVTGSFSINTLDAMLEMLSIMAGGWQALKEKPRAVFDVCPSPPLIWSDFAVENIIRLAQAGVPAEMISMPLAGSASPVTILGSVVQHTAESLAGLTIHQLANPGAPLVWGGAPAIFDMRKGTTPFGAAETSLIAAAYTQVGKSLGLPTHTYLGASDAKLVDAQAGMETGMSAMAGALAGINMISGAGMLDFLACQSLEKLVVDAEAIAWVQRFLGAIRQHTETLATEMFAGFQFKADFLKQRTTRELFKIEQHLPSIVIDRDSMRGWQSDGRQDTFQRAHRRVEQLLNEYQRPEIDEGQKSALCELVSGLGRQAGLDKLPILHGIA